MTTTDRETGTPPELADTLDRLTDALAAMSSGDPAPYAALWRDAPDVTLFGAWGTAERGHEALVRTFTWVAGRFSDGALVPRHDVVVSSGDLAYTVGFEHGEVRIDGGDPFPMTIRVTHILRRAEGRWWLVHRHADHPSADPHMSHAGSS